MTKNQTILAINPGSTSTKLAVSKGTVLVLQATIRHDDKEMLAFPTVAEQLPFRLRTLLDFLETREFDLQTLDAVVGRGGLLKPLESGTYEVNEAMLEDALTSKFGEHASNLGAVMAFEIASNLGIPAYIVDPVGVDELIDEARLSGFAELERKSHAHALNIKAVSRKVSAQLKIPDDEANFVVAHIGGGVSVVAIQSGRMIDVNNADNEGPFSPERAGGLPAKQLVKLCFSGKYSEKEMLKNLTKTGGVYSYLGTKNMTEVEERALIGDEQAAIVLNAMVHQIAKEIGAMAAVLDGELNGIILTGGISFSEFIVEKIKKKVQFLGPILVEPGEQELEALTAGALRVLNRLEKAKHY